MSPLRILLVSPLLLTLPSCDSDPKPQAASSATPQEEEVAAKDVIPAFEEYQRKSMRSEALVNTRQLADLLRSRVVEGEPIETLSVSPVAGSCCKQPKGVCQPGDGDWDAESWQTLGFQPHSPHRYSYQVDVKGTTVTVMATADLDCDGTLSTYAYEGVLKDDDLVFDFDKGAIETHPLE